MRKSHRFALSISMSIFMLLTLGISRGQIEAQCTTLNTQYPGFALELIWTDPGIVVFKTMARYSPNDRDGSLEAWYSYEPAAAKLTKLPGEPNLLARFSPAQVAGLDSAAAGKLAGFLGRMVIASPTGNLVVYPRMTGSEYHFWLRQVDAATSTDLRVRAIGIPNSAYRPFLFWFPSEKQFILQGLAWIQEPVWVEILGKEVKISAMSERSPWKDMGLGPIRFEIAGLSPTGRFLLVQPEPFYVYEKDANEHKLWVYDFDTLTLTKLDFFTVAAVGWRDDTTFVARARDGVIQYSIKSAEYRVLAGSPTIIGLAHTVTSRLSPDGRFLMGEMYDKVAVCVNY